MSYGRKCNTTVIIGKRLVPIYLSTRGFSGLICCQFRSGVIVHRSVNNRRCGAVVHWAPYLKSAIVSIISAIRGCPAGEYHIRISPSHVDYGVLAGRQIAFDDYLYFGTGGICVSREPDYVGGNFGVKCGVGKKAQVSTIWPGGL